jgi:hypothetical protein
MLELLAVRGTLYIVDHIVRRLVHSGTNNCEIDRGAVGAEGYCWRDE